MYTPACAIEGCIEPRAPLSDLCAKHTYDLSEKAAPRCIATDCCDTALRTMYGYSKYCWYHNRTHNNAAPIPEPVKEEYTGGSVSYYQASVDSPISGGSAYTAECGDIIEALGMDFNEGNAFKAIWRKCAARNLGKKKKGYTDGLYDAEKVVFYGERMVATEKARKGQTR